jgi:hypothetical protein
MRTVTTIALALALGAATLAGALAAPIATSDRNAIVTKIAMSYVAWNTDKDYAKATALCDEARAIAAAFDPDDWTQGHLDGCMADIAEAQGDRANACERRDSQIAHYERVMATDRAKLKKSLESSLASARTSRTALNCGAP